MSTLPTSSSRSKPPSDPILAALAVVLPLICARSLSSPEIAYVRTRLVRWDPATILEALEWLGDHADRIGNPIAAILDRCSAAARDVRERETADRMAKEMSEAKARRAAALAPKAAP